MKEAIKRLLVTVAPSLLDAYRSLNNRRLFRQRFGALHKRARAQFYGDGRIAVLTGPFRNMRYFDEIVWGSITPKWLGSYEAELHDIVEEIVARDYLIIIDVGCAEGYYAVGLAHRIAGASVFAYDSDFISRRQTKRLARLNGLERRVEIGGYCSHAEIARRATGRTLLFCDIEGFEHELLDPVACPALARIDILVEVHEGSGGAGVQNILSSRFASTHDLRSVFASDRSAWIRSTSINAPAELLHVAVDEHRNDGRAWLWMTARESRRTEDVVRRLL